MTTITASEYSPNHLAKPLVALKPGQVALLNQGKTRDISQKVRTVVQNHLGYKGTDVFRTTFTKQEITFTLTNPIAAETRTLKLENGLWKLSQDNVPVKDFELPVTDQINTLVTEILANIGKASQAPDPAPVTGAAMVEAVDAAVPAANAAELAEIRQRLTTLEDQLRANPTLEQSLEVQQRILEQLAGLRAALERHPEAGTAEREKLHEQVDQLNRVLVEEGRRNERTLALQKEEFEQAMKVSQGHFEKLQADLIEARRELARQQQVHGEKDQATVALKEKVVDLEAELALKTSEQKQLSEELRDSKLHAATVSRHKELVQKDLTAATRDLEKQQQALGEKGHAAAALQDIVTKLEATVSQKDAEQKQALEAFEVFKAEKESIQRQLQTQCAREEQAAKEAAAQNNLGVTALQEQQAQKAVLEKQLIDVLSELDQLKQTNQKNLAETSSQLKALKAEKTTLEARLGASTDEAKSANAELSQKIGELEKQIQAQQAQLENDERLNKSQAALIATQEKQLKELETLLTSTDENAGSTIASLQDQNKQLNDSLAQLQKAQEAAQNKNSSDLAAAISALQSLNATHETIHARQLQNTKETFQLLNAELSGLKQLLEGSQKALQDQIASTNQQIDTHSKQNRNLLQSLKQLDTKHADQVRNLESAFTKKQSALAAEQQKARQMEAQHKEKLDSQVKAVEAIQAEKGELETRFGRERQNLIRERDEALKVGKTAEAQIKILQEELRTIRQHLHEMRQARLAEVAAAKDKHLEAGHNTAATALEITALIAAVESVVGSK